jgi:molecular chaperone HscB
MTKDEGEGRLRITMTDHFQRLGLPRRFSIDEAALERAYLTLSRTVHPDFHLAGSGAELSASQELSAALNEAYNTLRDPFARADYLLTLEGGPSASEHKQLPQNFLAEMLEAREEVELARGSPAKVARLDEDFSKRSAAIVEQIGKEFGQYESFLPEDPRRVNLRAQVRGLLNAAKYVRGLLRDLQAD